MYMVMTLMKSLSQMRTLVLIRKVTGREKGNRRRESKHEIT